tara:strand:- start:2159 stop:2263 length:105 start_codon:yes stop_codon:yes gene_type:complete
MPSSLINILPRKEAAEDAHPKRNAVTKESSKLNS